MRTDDRDEEEFSLLRGNDEAVPEEVEEGAPLWMATFGDLMSLLLVFFILLYSMSELKVERFLLASESLNQAMGATRSTPVDDPMGLMPDPVDPELALNQPGASPSPATEGEAEGAPLDGEASATPGETGEEEAWLETFTDAYLEMIAKRLEAYVEEHDLQDRVRVEREGDGVYLRIETVVLFGSGEAVIRPAGEELIGFLARITREFGIPISVSGHADNQPISTPQFASNWELAAARAAGVARILVAGGQDPTRLRVESYGAFRPVAGNDTPEGRSRNRRVELFFARAEVREAARRWASEWGSVPGDPAATTGPSVPLADGGD